MKKFLIAASLVLIVSSCATIARYSIEDSLRNIGIPAARADCMGGQLKDRLSDDDLQDLARYLSGLSKSETPGEALDAMLKIDNARAVGAISASAISCAFAPKK
jgi:cytochrome c553